MSISQSEPLLVVRQATKRYRPRGGLRALLRPERRPQWVEALRGADLEVGPAELVVLVGPNGAGKSTLLSLAAGLARAESGSVVARRSDGLRVAYVRASHPGLSGRMPVGEQVRAHAAMGGEEALAERVATALERFGITALQTRSPQELSTGERLRVALACAEAAGTDLWLLDEVTANLDDATVAQLLSRLRATGAAALLASHDPRVSALCDRVVRLVDGRTVPAPPPEPVTTPPRTTRRGRTPPQPGGLRRPAARAVALASRVIGYVDESPTNRFARTFQRLIALGVVALGLVRALGQPGGDATDPVVLSVVALAWMGLGGLDMQVTATARVCARLRLLNVTGLDDVLRARGASELNLALAIGDGPLRRAFVRSLLLSFVAAWLLSPSDAILGVGSLAGVPALLGGVAAMLGVAMLALAGTVLLRNATLLFWIINLSSLLAAPVLVGRGGAGSPGALEIAGRLVPAGLYADALRGLFADKALLPPWATMLVGLLWMGLGVLVGRAALERVRRDGLAGLRSEG